MGLLLPSLALLPMIGLCYYFAGSSFKTPLHFLAISALALTLLFLIVVRLPAWMRKSKERADQ
jgi:hypothetical protein